MKKLCLITLVFIASYSYGQQVLASVAKARTAKDNSGDYLHRVANEFADEVGNKLKELYPAEVQNIEVKMFCSNGLVTLCYSCDIVRTEVENAWQYFDHRGALSSSANLKEAKKDAIERSRDQLTKAAEKFHENYGSVAYIYYGKTNYVFLNNKYLALSENFLASR